MHHLLNSKNKFLSDLITKSHESETLTQKVKQFLDDELAQHCKVLHVQKGCLTVAISSAIWATKFRYATANLLNRLRTEGKLYNLRTIKTIVEQPFSIEAKAQQNKVQHLTKTSADIIRQTASTISSESLRKALEKLAEV